MAEATMKADLFFPFSFQFLFKEGGAHSAPRTAIWLDVLWGVGGDSH